MRSYTLVSRRIEKVQLLGRAFFIAGCFVTATTGVIAQTAFGLGALPSMIATNAAMQRLKN